MSFFTEAPGPLIWTCLGVALVCLVLTKFTQRGAFLIWAGVAALVALLAFTIDFFVVTDAERIESVLHAVAAAASRSDAEGVLAHMTPDVSLEDGPEGRGGGGEIARGPIARALIAAALHETKFDYIWITQSQVDVGQISRQGKADFRIMTSGLVSSPFGHFSFATDASGADWSFGFVEESPGVWKVTRITAVRLPRGASLGRWLPSLR